MALDWLVIQALREMTLEYGYLYLGLLVGAAIGGYLIHRGFNLVDKKFA